MTNPVRTSRVVVGLALGVSACGVADSDPSLWKQSKALGRADYHVPGASDPGPGSSGAPGAGSGGDPNVSPDPAGGASAGGNGPPVGAGGTGGPIGGGSGGSGASPAGSGGFVDGAGGAFIGAGGAIIGAGGLGMGTGGSGAGGMTVTGNSGKCTFSFDVTTVTARGRYSPVNVGAIWISDAQSKFVKTLQWWGRVRLSNATAWVQATGSNKTDAVSGASRTSHGPLKATWDCTDVSKNAVADGQYVVHVTFAESDANPFFGGTPIQASVNFTKSPAGADTAGQDTANFTSMHVKLTVP